MDDERFDFLDRAIGVAARRRERRALDGRGGRQR